MRVNACTHGYMRVHKHCESVHSVIRQTRSQKKHVLYVMRVTYICVRTRVSGTDGNMLRNPCACVPVYTRVYRIRAQSVIACNVTVCTRVHVCVCVCVRMYACVYRHMQVRVHKLCLCRVWIGLRKFVTAGFQNRENRQASRLCQVTATR